MYEYVSKFRPRPETTTLVLKITSLSCSADFLLVGSRSYVFIVETLSSEIHDMANCYVTTHLQFLCRQIYCAAAILLAFKQYVHVYICSLNEQRNIL
jgi:hypothetical protein